LDPTFGSGGMGAGALFPGGAATAMAVQPDGSILAAGTYFSPSDPSGVFGLARYRRDGSVDRAFGVGGHVATGLSAALPGVPTSLAVDAAGGIVVLAGEVLLGNPELPSSYAPVLLRYLPDGRADT